MRDYNRDDKSAYSEPSDGGTCSEGLPVECEWRAELNGHRDFLNRFIVLSLPIHNGERILTLRDMRIRAYITSGKSDPVDHLHDMRKARWISLFFSEECKQMQREEFNEARFCNLISRISQQEEKIMKYTIALIECTKKVDKQWS